MASALPGYGRLLWPRNRKLIDVYPGRSFKVSPLLGYNKWTPKNVGKLHHLNPIEWRIVYRYVYQLGFETNQVLSVIRDVESYPKFVKWAKSATVYEKSDDGNSARVDLEFENDEYDLLMTVKPEDNQVAFEGHGRNDKSIFFSWEVHPGDRDRSARLWLIGGYFHSPVTRPVGYPRWPPRHERMKLSWQGILEDYVKNVASACGTRFGAPSQGIEHMTDEDCDFRGRIQIPVLVGTGDVERRFHGEEIIHHHHDDHHDDHHDGHGHGHGHDHHHHVDPLAHYEGHDDHGDHGGHGHGHGKGHH